MIKILVIGDIIIDKYIYGAVDRLAPDFLGMVFDTISEETFVGGAGLVAQTLANILPEDIEITLQGSVSDSHKGLLSPRIKLNQVSAESMIKTRYVATGQGRPDKPWGSQKIIRIDNIKKFSKSALKEESSRDQYDYIIVSDYNKDTIPVGFTVNNKTSKVIIDTKTLDLSKYNKCDILKINQAEAKNLKQDIEKVPYTITTYGKHPVSVQHHGYNAGTVPVYELSAHDRIEYDPCGAGDSFLAGFVYGMIVTKERIMQAIRYGNIAATLKVFTFGTEAISNNKYYKELENAKISTYLI